MGHHSVGAWEAAVSPESHAVQCAGPIWLLPSLITITCLAPAGIGVCDLTQGAQ